MRKYKITFNITLAILIITIILVVIHALLLFFSDVKYPYPALGIDVHNWYERFQIDIMFGLLIFGIPILIDVILFIISIFKLRKI